MLEKQKIIHMYIAGGKSLREISRELGVSRQAVTMSEINAWRDEFIFTDLTYGVRSNTGSSMKTCTHRAMSPMKKIKKSHEIHMETKFMYFCTSNKLIKHLVFLRPIQDIALLSDRSYMYIDDSSDKYIGYSVRCVRD